MSYDGTVITIHVSVIIGIPLICLIIMGIAHAIEYYELTWGKVGKIFTNRPTKDDLCGRIQELEEDIKRKERKYGKNL